MATPTPAQATEAFNFSITYFAGVPVSPRMIRALEGMLTENLAVRHVKVTSRDAGIFVVDVFPHSATAFRLTLGAPQVSA